MNILVPAIPARYRIPDTMWEELIWDPVMAANVLLGSEYDAFQAARMRYYWFVQEVEDHSGNSTGKTRVIWDFCQLRAMLIPDQWVLVYYPTFDVGKATFWEYYASCKHPVFLAHLGGMDKKEDGGLNKGAGCYTARYRNGNKLEMPAPSAMKDGETQVSRRCNTLVVEEFTVIDAMGNAIDSQLKNRNQRPCWNQFHPVWANHTLYSAPAETQSHPAHARHKDLMQRQAKGDPRVHTMGYSFKDWSNLTCERTGKSFRDEFRMRAIMDSAKSKADKGVWMGKGLGIWGLNGEGWFTEEAIDRAIRHGEQAAMEIMLSRN